MKTEAVFPRSPLRGSGFMPPIMAVRSGLPFRREAAAVAHGFIRVVGVAYPLAVIAACGRVVGEGTVTIGVFVVAQNIQHDLLRFPTMDLPRLKARRNLAESITPVFGAG